jgi:hypothetical protein
MTTPPARSTVQVPSSYPQIFRHKAARRNFRPELTVWAVLPVFFGACLAGWWKVLEIARITHAPMTAALHLALLTSGSISAFCFLTTLVYYVHRSLTVPL